MLEGVRRKRFIVVSLVAGLAAAAYWFFPAGRAAARCRRAQGVAVLDSTIGWPCAGDTAHLWLLLGPPRRHAVYSA